MKPGRKAAAQEKTRDVAGLVAGRDPGALFFARWLAEFAKSPTTTRRRGVRPVLGIPAVLDPDSLASEYPMLVPSGGPWHYLAHAAAGGDDTFADFLESVARYIRAGHHKRLFVDEQRLALRYIVRQRFGEPPGNSRINVSDLVGLLGQEGVLVSEKTAAVELRELGYAVRTRGRP